MGYASNADNIVYGLNALDEVLTNMAADAKSGAAVDAAKQALVSSAAA